MGTALRSIWPLFGLKVIGPQIELRLPTMEEYAKLARLAGRVGVSDQDEWTFANPWNQKASPELEQGMLQHYCRKFATWGESDRWCLMLGIFFQGRLVGMQDAWTRNPYHLARSAETGSWIVRSFQGRGLGKEARGAILHLFFDHLSAVEMYSGAFETNRASRAVSKHWGYQPNGTHLQTVAGKTEAKHLVGLRLTKQRWTKQQVTAYRVEGVEGCLPLFGLAPKPESVVP